MSGLIILSKIVLANVKLPSEHAEHIIPFLRKIKNDYGSPRACVHDLGTGILKAVSEVFAGVADFICHFHFLRDIGNDFLGPVYAALRQHLRRHGISSRLHALARDTRQPLAEQPAQCAGLAQNIKEAACPEDIGLTVAEDARAFMQFVKLPKSTHHWRLRVLLFIIKYRPLFNATTDNMMQRTGRVDSGFLWHASIVAYSKPGVPFFPFIPRGMMG